MGWKTKRRNALKKSVPAEMRIRNRSINY